MEFEYTLSLSANIRLSSSPSSSLVYRSIRASMASMAEFTPSSFLTFISLAYLSGRRPSSTLSVIRMTFQSDSTRLKYSRLTITPLMLFFPFWRRRYRAYSISAPSMSSVKLIELSQFLVCSNICMTRLNSSLGSSSPAMYLRRQSIAILRRSYLLIPLLIQTCSSCLKALRLIFVATVTYLLFTFGMLL